MSNVCEVDVGLANATLRHVTQPADGNVLWSLPSWAGLEPMTPEVNNEFHIHKTKMAGVRVGHWFILPFVPQALVKCTSLGNHFLAEPSATT